TKSDILKHFKLNPDKIEVIYNGVDDKFFDKIDYRRVKRMKERYQLDYPFILYAGNVRPHKNLSGLINCFDELIEPPFNKYRLVIAGYELARNKTLRRLISKKNLQNRVRFLGYITQVEYLYKLAEIFINPSLYEGFGVSILEAMAIGTPVIASNKSALPEIAGEAAILVDPYNSIEIADSIKKIISDKGARAKLIKMGKDRACEFKWEESVRRLIDVYSEILK
ncbi:MAG: glycosyltransferase family 4 protein, partial [Acidobacteria bacterium]|nr:glycosyltransferase family 4 protein [Acidobacteriota bacterium]